mmetsp:Transcript_7879/g.16856  ORF Transcript_7879/g.16856 Transcript_7879/m.16856 type:complete len:199 (-) Transcript_7879:501-1097(-)|eukprot:CAMPEP_0171350314 /NCGR_PEP_ID=MMETSP0878-20121228/36149_1 /TAXON_ID=67004 /ORGANISM="Thalassiosira weissflogii, Strain CCMP1336" /LENGTH=198 /DNA_ID=CAMNT_0011855219 /DNA_START=109 /DNA_END=705 /DNA_ORIENTATION=-
MDDRHSKAQSWQGWSDAKTNIRHFGLELQAPFSDHILCGRKSIETRAYPLPPALLSSSYHHQDKGEYQQHEVRIDILESQQGADGVSSIPNQTSVALHEMTISQTDEDASIRPPLLRKGWCTFIDSFQYTSREQFENDEEKHMVHSNSGYGWSDNRPMFGWVVGNFRRYTDDYDEFSAKCNNCIAERRMRSLFELKSD